MCPDIDTYAPLIEAGFGLGDVVGERGHPAHRLRVRLADRSPVPDQPAARGRPVAARDRRRPCAGHPGARPRPHRAGAPEVRVHRRRPRAARHLDPRVRGAMGLRRRPPRRLRPRVDYVANTWEFGLDRLLSGVALSDDSSAWLDRALPLDDVGSAQVDLVGRLAEYVDRLRDVTDRLTGTHSLDHWLEALGDGVTTLTAVSPADGWQSGQVQRELGRVRHAGRRRRRPAAARRPRSAVRAAGRTTHASQLPHGHPHRLHDGADAVGAPPRGLPARPRRRRVPSSGLRRR